MSHYLEWKQDPETSLWHHFSDNADDDTIATCGHVLETPTEAVYNGLVTREQSCSTCLAESTG